MPRLVELLRCCTPIAGWLLRCQRSATVSAAQHCTAGAKRPSGVRGCGTASFFCKELLRLESAFSGNGLIRSGCFLSSLHPAKGEQQGQTTEEDTEEACSR